MNVVIILGPQAVGKMTVGQELSKRLGYLLLYNHLTIEPVIELYGFYNPRVSNALHKVLIKDMSKIGYDFILTFATDFSEEEWGYLESIQDIIKRRQPDCKICKVFLDAPLNIRLARNVTENRLEHKKSKRDLELSKSLLLSAETPIEDVDGYKKRTSECFYIDNSTLTAEEVASLIIEHFNLEVY